MLTVFPQGLNDWRLRQTQSDRNASLSQQTLSLEDVFYALAAIEAKIGRDGTDITTSLDYRVAVLEALSAMLGNVVAGRSPFSVLWFDGSTVQWTTSPTIGNILTVRQIRSLANAQLRLYAIDFDIYGDGLRLHRFGANPAVIIFPHAAHGTETSPTAMADTDQLLGFRPHGFHGDLTVNGGYMDAMQFDTYVDGAVSSGIVPGKTVIRERDAAGNMNDVMAWRNDKSTEFFGKVKTFNNVAAAGYGVPAIVALDQYTNRTTSIGSTNLAGTTPTGLYRVSVYIEGKSFPTGIDTVFLTLTWKDNASNNVSETTATITLSSSGQHTYKEFFIRHTGAGSASISYATTKAGAGGDGYDLLITAERLN
jgi:hypothetical protein